MKKVPVPMINYHTFDKSEWPAGEWNNEPDKKQWQDKATGYPCLIVRSKITGALCGYVGVPPEHPMYKKDYSDIDVIDVHGGLTFSARCQEGKDESVGICHIADEGEDEDDVWWLGFDCSHYQDLMPAFETHHVAFNTLTRGVDDVYRNMVYVKTEVESLAGQLKEFAA